MAPTVEECITLPNGMKMPRLALGTWKVIYDYSFNQSQYNSKILLGQSRKEVQKNPGVFRRKLT